MNLNNIGGHFDDVLNVDVRLTCVINITYLLTYVLKSCLCVCMYIYMQYRIQLDAVLTILPLVPQTDSSSLSSEDW